MKKNREEYKQIVGEEWKQITYDPRYEISSMGRIKRGNIVLKGSDNGSRVWSLFF